MHLALSIQIQDLKGPPATGTATQARLSAAQAKQQLLRVLEGTRRGADASVAQRGEVEEAQVAVESLAGDERDFALLKGLWKLVYTTAVDVIPIIRLDDLPSLFGVKPVIVGDIYQRFSSPTDGIVENVIKLSDGVFLQPGDGVTVTVRATYDVLSTQRISLTFQEAQVDSIKLSPTAEALLAPALLPRGSLNHQLLLAIRDLQLRLPFRSAAQVAARQAIPSNYQLTYLDEDMLIGRAFGGVFIFVKERE